MLRNHENEIVLHATWAQVRLDRALIVMITITQFKAKFFSLTQLNGNEIDQVML